MTELNDDLAEIAHWRARLAALVDACDMMHQVPVHEAVRARFDPDGTLVDLHINPDALKDYTNIQLQQIITDVLRITRARVCRLMRAHVTSFLSGYARSDHNSAGFAPTRGEAADASGTRLHDAKTLWCQLETTVNRSLAWLTAAHRDGWGPDGPADAGETRVYAESSRDGAITLALDRTGTALWCRLKLQANQWSPDVTADRIVRLNTLALMRARCDERSRLERRFGPELAADIFSKAPGAYPDKQAVKRYRQQCVDF